MVQHHYTKSLIPHALVKAFTNLGFREGGGVSVYSLFFCLFVYLAYFFRFHYLDVVASRERRWESRRNEFSKFSSQIITVPS